MATGAHVTDDVKLFKSLAGLVASVTDSSEAFLSILLNTANQALRVKASSLALLDETTDSLIFSVTTGEEGEQVRNFSLKRGEGIIGWVVERGEPTLAADVATDPRWSSRVADSVGLKTQSIACAPLLVEGAVIGALEIIDKVDGLPLTEDDLTQLQSFADLAAVALNRSDSIRKERGELARLRKKMDENHRIIGSSGALMAVMEKGRKVAASRATTLITGESGSGKELFARLIHNYSDRSSHPLVTVNCGALAESLLERELFGHEKGAFTGADRTSPGLFEVADKGTLFLDEIGETTPAMQVKLLRVLQEGVFIRVGGQKEISVDVRVVAATNRDLKQQVVAGAFREDLYYRLNVIELKLPSLRERSSDIPELVDYFLRKVGERPGRPKKTIGEAALAAMTGYHWPGNIRQLENAVERAVIMCEGEVIEPADLPPEVRGEEAAIHADQPGGGYPPGLKLKEAQNIFRRDYIAAALKRNDGKQGATARELGVQRSYLNKLIKELGVIAAE